MVEEETHTGLSMERRSDATEHGGKIAPWRRAAVDRVFKGLSVAGSGVALGVAADILNLVSGVSGLGMVVGAAALMGVGGLWAGLGASHLIRYGKKGSAVPLLSLTGLGGSILGSVATYTLLLWSSNPFLVGLNQFSMAASGVFTAILMILGLVTVVRWLFPDEDVDPEEDAEPIGG